MAGVNLESTPVVEVFTGCDGKASDLSRVTDLETYFLQVLAHCNSLEMSAHKIKYSIHIMPEVVLSCPALPSSPG